MEKALPWLNRLQRSFYREAAFLPKRLVSVTLLLLVIYLMLLIRTDQKIRQSALGFVEANLQSKLVADYEQAAKPPTPLAPLRLEILRAKLQDENPAWSAAAVEAALQQALAAAAAPILQATPTPYPRSRMIVYAAGVVTGQRVVAHPTTATGIRLGSEQPIPGTATVTALVASTGGPAHAVGASTTAPAVAFAMHKPTAAPTHEHPAASIVPSTATPAVIILLVPAPGQIAPSNATLPSGQASNGPTLNEPALNEPTLTTTPRPAANSTATMVPVTRLAASQPDDGGNTLLIPTSTIIEGWVPPMTATPTATSTASPTPTSTATATVQTESHEAQPGLATVTATATSLVLAPLVPTDDSVLTPLPSPTATAAPTITPTPTLLPAINGVTAQAAEDKVILAWEPAAGDIVGYNLYRGESVAGPPGERRNEAALGNATYVDMVILDGRRYFYYVTVVDQQNRESLPSAAVTVTVADRTPPHTPNLLSLHLSGAQLQIRWQTNSEADLAGYRLYRSTSWPVDRTQGPLHGATLLTTPSYLDQVVLNGQTYYYVFTAVDLAGNESRPSIDAQMPTIDLTAPAAPTGLRATTQQDHVDLTWQPNNEADLAGYRLYRSDTLPVDTNGPPLHNQPLLTMPSYSDLTATTDKHYYYTVVAVDGNQNSSSASEAILASVK